jgi:hypothetical protein
MTDLKGVKLRDFPFPSHKEIRKQKEERGFGFFHSYAVSQSQ